MFGNTLEARASPRDTLGRGRRKPPLLPSSVIIPPPDPLFKVQKAKIEEIHIKGINSRKVASGSDLDLALEVHDERRVKRGHGERSLHASEFQSKLNDAQLCGRTVRRSRSPVYRGAQSTREGGQR